ncbi:sigma-70 family RNA polymerase sigma factor [Patulibacter sp. NPDC049589]|uniref:RNA polymerase sigma factor n=1 Tax=Patulibacter sp. NPDC049589 TaxID=3154731 RepID=UPI00343EB68F
MSVLRTAPDGGDREASEERLLDRLRDGDEAAFDHLVVLHTPGLLRLARTFVSTQAVAEEVVQETWLGVLRGIDRFEGRSSLRTWIYRILANRAQTRGVVEHRTVPFATLAGRELGEDFTAVGPERFLPADHDRWPHHWAAPPRRWDVSPEAALSHAETLRLVQREIAALPAAQRAVVTMRDLEGLDADEVCTILDLTAGNQRVLLHRGRSRIRAALEAHLAP